MNDVSNGQLKAELQKRWIYIIPAVFITYSLAYVDRANYGFGAAAGLASELHISEQQSALLASLFFLGYFSFQIPGAVFARRHGIRTPISIALIGWGIFAALTGVIHSFWLLVADRFLLGVAESFVMPSMLILLTRWFTRSERSRANTLLILGNPVTILWMSAVTGYVIHRFGWQTAFVIEGLPSVLWGIAWLFIISDTPAVASWMSPAARDHLLSQQRLEQISLQSSGSEVKTFRQSTVWGLISAFFLWSIGVYGFVLWIPSIIRRGASAGMTETGLLSAVPYFAAIVCMLCFSYLSDRRCDRRRYVWPMLLLAGICMYVSYIFISQSFWTAYISLIFAGALMYAPYGPFFALISETYCEGAAVGVIAAVNSAGALGAFLGSWIVGVLDANTQSARAGFLFMAASLVLAAVVFVLFAPGKSGPLPGVPVQIGQG